MMYQKREHKINGTMQQEPIARPSIRRTLVGLLSCLLVGIVAYYCSRVLGYTALLASMDEGLTPSIALLALLHAACFALVACVTRALADAATSLQPISRRQSLRLAVTSALLGACAVLEAALLLTIATYSGSAIPAMYAGLFEQIADLAVAFALAIAAIIIFCFSYLMDYCAFLQWFYDETV